MFTLGTLRDEVKDRLHLGATAAEPGDARLLQYALVACEQAFAELPPVFELAVTLDVEREALVPELLRVLYVQKLTDLLADHEWGRIPGGLKTRSEQVGGEEDTLFVWYTRLLDLSAATELTEVDSDCIFGMNWLREYIVTITMRSAQLFQVRVGAGAGSATHGAIYRVTGDDLKAQYDKLAAVWGQWNQMMLEKRQLRLQFVRPLSLHGAQGLRSIGRVRNPLWE